MALTSITKDFVVKAGLTVEGTAAVSTSSATSGALQVNGGVAIAKNLAVGSTSTLYGTLSVSQTSTFAGVTATSIAINQTLLIGSTSTFNSNLIVNSNLTDTVNTSNNAIYVSGGGGIGVSGTLKVAGLVTFDNSTDATSLGTGALVLSNGGLSVNQQARIGGALTVGGITTINTTTIADTGGNGALSVTGGVFVGKNLIVASTASNTTTDYSNALYVEGGAWIKKNFTVSGPAVFSDTVTFNGTATYVYSTNTFYTDNIIELHTPPGGVNSNWAVDDGKDIGIRIHYYGNGADQNAALVLADDSKYLEWYGTGAESSTGTFVGASYGTFKTGKIILTNTDDGGSTTTGALQIAGGAGIGGHVYIGGGLQVVGDISGSAISGDSLKATSLQTATNTLVYADASGLLHLSSISLSGGTLTGTISTATNLAGGAYGSIPYQTAPGTTSFISIGSETTVLTVVGGVPSWKSASGTTVGNASYAVTATNIAGGIANEIPYQSSTGTTVFNPRFTFNGSVFTTTNIVVTSGTNATSTLTGAIQVAGGVGIQQDLWVGGNVNIGGTLFFNGVGADQVTSNTGTFVNISATGTGVAVNVTNSAYIGQNLQVGNSITATSLILTGSTQSTSTNTGALQVVGGVGIGGAVNVGNSITANNGLYSINTFTGTYSDGIIVDYLPPAIGATGSGRISVGPNDQLALYSGGLNGTLLATFTTGTSSINSTAQSISTNTGALTVNGGVGVAGNLVVGGNITGTTLNITGQSVLGLVTATAITATSLIVNGPAILGATTATSLNVITTATVSSLSVTTATDSTLVTNGSIVTQGGVGVAKSMTVGGSITVGTVATSSTVAAIFSNNSLYASFTSNIISGSGTQQLDTFSATAYRTAKYLVQIVDGTSVHVEEILIFHDGTAGNVYITEYAVATNNGELGNFNVVISSNIITLQFTPYSASSMTIKLARTTMTT